MDAIPMPDGRVLLAIADVCGKGLHAAPVASSIHTMVHATLDAGASVGHLMERLNAHLCDFLPDHSFVTMACLVLDRRSGELECHNAGHLPPVLLNAHKAVGCLPAGVNLPLGITPGPVSVQRAYLADGDVLMLYTDGVCEGRDSSNRMLGIEAVSTRICELLSSSPTVTAEAIGQHVAHVLEEFRGQRVIHDDTTFLVARRVRGPAVRRETGHSARTRYLGAGREL